MSDPKGENILERVTPAAAEALRTAIEAADGNEVFFAGALDDAGRVCAVRVCARGNEGAVPALFEGLGVRDVVLHNHPGGRLTPSNADLNLASVYSAHGHGFLIIDNEATRVYVVVEPFAPSAAEKLEAAELERAFGPESPLAKRLTSYEERPQQIEMMHCVTRSFNNDGICAVEAPDRKSVV